MRFSFVFLALCLVCFSCGKPALVSPEDLPPLDQPVTSTASVKLVISHHANGTALLLNPASTYVTANHDTFSVKVFKYYLSNVKLLSASGQTVSIADSYYLVDEAHLLSKTLTLSGIPSGEYTQLSFMIGVDSTRNVSGAQTGALDPSHGMFWTWNSGYIMAKLEGSSPQSGNGLKDLTFHIGGFSGNNKGIRTVTLPLPLNAHVHSEHQTQINLSGDVAKWFSGINTIDFSVNYDVMAVNSRSRSIADNYARMFTVTSVVN